jgi:hypothetical protein
MKMRQMTQQFPIAGSGIREVIKKVNDLMIPMQTAMIPMQAWFYGTTIVNQWKDFIKGISENLYGLPPIEPELVQFLSELESPNIEKRNKAILTKLLEMNTRYLSLNTTPAKDAYNKIMHITTLNVLRNPERAPEYLGQAEITNAKLLKEYLGSESNHSERGWLNYNPLYTTADAILLKSGITLEEPTSLSAIARDVDKLPSSLLYKIPVPREFADPLLLQIKTPHINTEERDLPRYKQPQGVEIVTARKLRKHRKRRNRRSYRLGGI